MFIGCIMTIRLLSFGSNGNYQLGLGDDKDRDEPDRVDDSELFSTAITMMASGGNHTLFLLENGDLYGVGLNTSNQLGPKLLFGEVCKQVWRIPLPSQCKLVACGWEFSIVITASEKVMVAGFGSKGELGLGPSVTSTAGNGFMPIPDFPPFGTSIHKVATGMSHTVVLLSDGTLWGWGAGRKGQLGEPVEKCLWSPRRLYCNSHFEITHISCGRDFTVMGSSSTGQVKVVGNNNLSNGTPGI